MNGALDWLYAKKAYAASIILAIVNLYNLVLAVTADKAITLDEAQGVWMALGSALSIVGIHVVVFRTRNASRPS